MMILVVGDYKHYDDDDGDDDIYIMVRCMSVCYEKAPLSVFRGSGRFTRL